MGWRIGVDIGGTFTDVAVLDETSGRVGIAKVSTTPHDVGAAVIEGTRAAMDEYRIAPETVSLLSHATTIVTNALLESKGANVALVATRGFRDVLEVMPSEKLSITADCGFSALPRYAAREKMTALVAGTRLVRSELGNA